MQKRYKNPAYIAGMSVAAILAITAIAPAAFATFSTGTLSQGGTFTAFKQIFSGTQRMGIALGWDKASNDLWLDLYDPGGSLRCTSHTLSPTSVQECYIGTPQVGTWKYNVIGHSVSGSQSFAVGEAPP